MTILLGNPLDTTSTVCTSTALDQMIDDPTLATTVCSLASTITSHMNHHPMVCMNNANRFLDSLSTEELYEMEQKLMDKENNIIELNEKPKEFIKRI